MKDANLNTEITDAHPQQHGLDAKRLYQLINQEIARKEYHSRPKTQAIAAAQGDKTKLKALYLMFRYEELCQQIAQQQQAQKNSDLASTRFELYENEQKSAPPPAKFLVNKWRRLFGLVLMLSVLWFSSDSLISNLPQQKVVLKSQQQAIKSASKIATRPSQVAEQVKLKTLPEQAIKKTEPVIFSKQAVQAVATYRLAAERGDAAAQFHLGLSYENGSGILADKVAAVAWYHKAAAQNLIHAQFKLAVMYATGQGVAQDDRQAFAWFHKAAQQGDVDAQFNVGVLYEKGKGVTRDKQQAVTWYRKAAEQGFVDAQFNLGVIYVLGQDGIPKDEAQAATWFAKAAAQGDMEAKKNFNMLGEIIDRRFKNTENLLIKRPAPAK